MAALGVAAASIFATDLSAQPSAPLTPSGGQTLKAVRIETGEAPVIDGDLSDPVWARAALIDGFRQVDPETGDPGSQRTVLRVLYDENNLYFSVYAYDREPDQIVVRARARDSSQAAGDYVRIYIDPNLTRRDGYAFEIGAGGGRTDGLIQNNLDEFPEWNTIWEARSRVVADGWVAEVAIPFRSLSYDKNRTDWGFDFARYIRRRAERDRWTSLSPAIPQTDISQSGTLTGIIDTNSGIGLDVQVYARLTAQRDWRLEPDRDGLNGFFSGNAYYKIAQGLTGTLTVNPDFSNSPLDERQVNTTRFSLFFPETRDFFLQDAFAFEFGGRDFSSTPNGRPFLSRNLGLVNGRPVTIFGGGKLSGTYDDIGVGAVSVRTNSTPAARGQQLSVFRTTVPVLAESKAGFIVTNGDPTGLTRNTVVGADFQYLNTHIAGDDILTSDFFYERSFSSAAGQDDTFGTAIYYPNEPWGGILSFKQVGRDFTPALGFLNRPAIRDYVAEIRERTRYRGTYLRSLQFGMSGEFITGLDNRLQSRQLRVWTDIQNRTIDRIDLSAYNYFENVPATFKVASRVPILPGKYEWTNFVGIFDTTNGRAWVITWRPECCSFYNGSYFKSDLAVTLRLRDLIEFAPHYVATWINLPTGYVAIHVLQGVTTINFTPDMQLVLQGQFDNISRSFSFAARYRWEYEPGNEIFAAIGQSAIIPGTSFEPQTSQVSLRLGHTFRF